MRPDGFVLAGGASRRMGVDKARVALGGWPLALHVLEALAPACGRVALVRRGGDDGLPWVDRDHQPLEVVWEADAGERHPLAGVASALRAARTEVVVVAPCDVPWMRSEVIDALVAAAPSVALADGRRHLVAALPTSWLGAIEAACAAGDSVRHALAEAREVAVPADALRNVNHPSDLPPHPLAASLAFLGAEAIARALAGERERLRWRGAVLPSQNAHA